MFFIPVFAEASIKILTVCITVCSLKNLKNSFYLSTILWSIGFIGFPLS